MATFIDNGFFIGFGVALKDQSNRCCRSRHESGQNWFEVLIVGVGAGSVPINEQGREAALRAMVIELSLRTPRRFKRV